MSQSVQITKKQKRMSLGNMKHFVVLFAAVALVSGKAKSDVLPVRDLKLRIQIDSEKHLNVDVPRALVDSKPQVVESLREITSKLELSYSLTVANTVESEWQIASAYEAQSKCWFKDCRVNAIRDYLRGIQAYLELRERFARASFLLNSKKQGHPDIQALVLKNERRFDGAVQATHEYFNGAIENAEMLGANDETNRESWLKGYYGVLLMYSDVYQQIVMNNVEIALQNISLH
jgi:hypothetical protein